MKDYDEIVTAAHETIEMVVPGHVGIEILSALETGAIAMFVLDSSQVGLGASWKNYDGLVNIGMRHVEWKGTTWL